MAKKKDKKRKDALKKKKCNKGIDISNKVEGEERLRHTM